MKKTSVISIIFLFGLFLSLSGCGDPLKILNDAIDTLEKQSVDWQGVLKETRDKLINAGQSTLANEVSNVLSGAISDIGIEARCYTDFLRDRVREDLIRIRSSITGEKLLLTPVFCNPTPSTVDMKLLTSDDPNRLNRIEIDGYNLEPGLIKIYLVDNQGSRTLVESSAIGNPSSYLLTLNLGENGIGSLLIQRSEIDYIEFKFPNSPSKTVSVIRPIPPDPTYTYEIVLATWNCDSCDAAKDGEVYITLIGTKRSTGEIKVDGDFRHNEWETVIVSYQDLGDISYVVIRYDDGKDHNAWHLAWIRITNITTNAIIWFPMCDQWYGHQNPLQQTCVWNP